jgi:PPOX class probable F420-dependent enzyme
MFDDTARDFFQKRLIARLSTIGTDGYPHTVPIWFMLDGTDIIFISDRTARKTQNALRNSKGAVVIGGDVNDPEGYLVRGDFVIEDDPVHAVTHRMVDRYETPADGNRLKEAWKNDDIVVIRLKPKSVIKVR